MASRKGWLSMSPIVPPISVMQNEGLRSPSLPTLPSLGEGSGVGLCSIRRLISSVMWGTTCMVLPR